jgi:hypothetical protein
MKQTDISYDPTMVHIVATDKFWVQQQRKITLHITHNALLQKTGSPAAVREFSVLHTTRSTLGLSQPPVLRVAEFFPGCRAAEA